MLPLELELLLLFELELLELEFELFVFELVLLVFVLFELVLEFGAGRLPVQTARSGFTYRFSFPLKLVTDGSPKLGRVAPPAK